MIVRRELLEEKRVVGVHVPHRVAPGQGREPVLRVQLRAVGLVLASVRERFGLTENVQAAPGLGHLHGCAGEQAAHVLRVLRPLAGGLVVCAVQVDEKERVGGREHERHAIRATGLRGQSARGRGIRPIGRVVGAGRGERVRGHRHLVHFSGLAFARYERPKHELAELGQSRQCGG